MGTNLYLLHLPVRRRTYFLRQKLSTGIGLLLASVLLPILLYAGWAACGRGLIPRAFEWSMISPALHVWLLMPLVYLGAFASGISRARWVGSRLLPLLAVMAPAVYLYNTSWLAGLPVLGVVSAAFISDILLEAATRDFSSLLEDVYIRAFMPIQVTLKQRHLTLRVNSQFHDRTFTGKSNGIKGLR